MQRDKALAIVEKQLKKPRYEHTVRVMETSIKLAEKYGADVKKAETAAIFHDYAKYRPLEEMQRWIEIEQLPKDLLHYHHELWHGPVGALMAEREVGINDPDVLHAITVHTTGCAGMSVLDKVVFLADYIEPGRAFPGVDEVRKVSEDDLDKACWMASRNTINMLVSLHRKVYPDTFHAYNDLLNPNGGNA
jgi:predicted HD superfamily hydrolase involved in NAD metabolism